MRYLKKGVNLSLSLTCCRAPAVAQMSPKESKWHSPAACEPKSHLEKPNPGGKHRPVAGHRDAGGVTLWPSSRGSRFSLPSSSGLPKSPRFPQPHSLLSSGQQDPILFLVLGGLELSLTPPMGKCWNEEEGKPRAFVLREQKTSSACPWVQLLQTLQIGLLFCFAFKCFFSQCDLKKIIIFFFLAGGCLFGRQSQSRVLHLAHPAYPQSMHKPSPLGSFPLGFPVALQWPSLCVWYRRQKGQQGQASCAVSSSPLPMGARCEVGERWEGYSCESGEKCDWQETILRKKMPLLMMVGWHMGDWKGEAG